MTHLTQVSTLDSIPIIDLNDTDTINLVQKISQASEVCGFSQIINHGVPEELCNRMMTAYTQFFKLPAEEKAQYFTTDHTKQVKLFNYFLKIQGQEKVTMWSETFSHFWHPTNLLPENPPQYREVFIEYAKEIGTLMNRLLELLSQGLGLEKDCLHKKLGENPTLKAQANYYPPCPDPELTLGLAVHTDLNALTVLRQTEGVKGLQVIKDGNGLVLIPSPMHLLSTLVIKFRLAYFFYTTQYQIW
ncbi:hypothetical protein ACLB2K_036844 [Fragaria x ananassa]